MYLKKVTLQNFRCFEQFEIELHPHLTVLVGLNGAGKTAVLDGIAAGLSPVLRYLSSAGLRLSAAGAGIRDTDFRLVPWGKKSGKERWGASEYAQIIIESTEGLRWDEWRASTKRKGIVPLERVGQRSLASHLSEISESFKSESRELLPVFAYYGAQRGSIEVPKRLRSAKDTYGHPASALVDSLDPRSNFREMLAWFEQEESSELRRNKGLKGEDWDLSPALQGVREAIRMLLNENFGNPYFNEFHRFVVESKTDHTPFQVSQLSQGYQSMLALGMDFARRLALGNDHLDFSHSPIAIEKLFDFLHGAGRSLDGAGTGVATKFAPAVMLVDEIDLHLHPSWQQRVLADLTRVFPATQFIVTTHSPQVLSTVRKENIRVLATAFEGNAVATQPLASTYGQPSGDVLETVMQVNPLPPVPEREDLHRVTELVDQGLYGVEEARQLLLALSEALGEQHPQLQRLHRSIRRQETLKQ